MMASMVKPFFIALFSLLTLQMQSAEVLIKGKAIGLENQFIDLVSYKDYLTLSEFEMASVKVDADAGFELRFDLVKTSPVLFKSGSLKSMMYCEPGKVYNVKLSTLPVLNRPASDLNLQFLFPEAGELNQQIIAFNQSYVDLLVENEKAFVARRATPVVKKFILDQKAAQGTKEKNYFQKYLKYNLAIIEESTLNNDASIFKAYFKDSKIEEENFEYMSLFRQFYQKRFENLASASSAEGVKLIESVNKSTNYDEFISLLKNDKYISGRDSLAELLGIFGLMETYHLSGLFKKKQTEQMLLHISKKGIFREIAANCFDYLTYLTKGTNAPILSFTDINNRVITREEFKNKNVYLQFWSLNATSSLRDMVLLKELAEKQSSSLEIISVNLDNSKKEIETFLRNKNYDWHFVRAVDNRKLIKEFRVLNAPFYVLINKEGEIQEYPAKSPSEGINNQFK